MALQMINIQVAYLAPEVVITDLGPRIENLQSSLDLLTISLEEKRTEFARILGKITDGDSANIEQLQRLARHVLSEATTIHESTIAGGSVHGDLIADEVQARTLNWIPEIVTKEQGSSKLSVTRSQDERTPPSEAGSIPDADLSEGRTSYNDTELASSDLDDEFEFEVTQRLIDKGKKLFNSAKYAEALDFLQKGVTIYNRPSSGFRLQLDLTEVPLIIAICKYHLEDLGQAESDLLELVRQESCSDQDAIRKCRIADILSQIYLIKNQLETAEDYCRKSLKGRRRLLGKEHADYFASLGLLSDICSRRGNKEEAEIYQDIIPPEIARLQKNDPTRRIPRHKSPRGEFRYIAKPRTHT
ncbi:hypothetical protein GJ744_004067 [Endocarpon pusillum]|uniref:Uncharacterized protein n=1 Tax=Endocarpon pusillum TaxID=364733 RepID=A0A8H7A950_9EURO|nr:hypothetical protein GJ744_004067 [Endocarpon pusillum]